MAEASRNMDFEEAARLRDEVVRLRAGVEGESEADVLKDLKKSARKGFFLRAVLHGCNFFDAETKENKSDCPIKRRMNGGKPFDKCRN